MEAGRLSWDNPVLAGSALIHEKEKEISKERIQWMEKEELPMEEEKMRMQEVEMQMGEEKMWVEEKEMRMQEEEEEMFYLTHHTFHIIHIYIYISMLNFIILNNTGVYGCK